MVVFTA